MSNVYLEKIASMSRGEKTGYGTAATAAVLGVGNEWNKNRKIKAVGLDTKIQEKGLESLRKSQTSKPTEFGKYLLMNEENRVKASRKRDLVEIAKIRKYHAPATKAMKILAGAGTAYGLYSTATK